MANRIVVPDVAKTRHAAARMLGTFSPIDGNSQLHFFSNQPTLGAATILTDFTEIVLPGYAPILLSGVTNGGFNGNDQDLWEWATILVTPSSNPAVPVTAYGYWVTSTDDGELLWCQTFDVPFTWASTADTLGLTPPFYFGQI